MSLAISTRSLTNRAKVLARNPAPNLILGILVRGTVGSMLTNCVTKVHDYRKERHTRKLKKNGGTSNVDKT